MMIPTSSRRISRMGRRNFISSLAKIGISSEAIRHLDPQKLRKLTDDPTDRVPRLRCLKHTNHEEVKAGDSPPEREPVFYTIDRDEWELVEGSIDAMKTIDRRMRARYNGAVITRLDVTGEYTISVGILTNTGSPVPTGSPQITVDQVRENVPDVAIGKATKSAPEIKTKIEVELIDAGLNNHTPFGHFDNSYRYPGVPGGCLMNGGCTIATPAHDGTSYVLVTAGHCADGVNEIHQPESGYAPDSSIGSVSEWEFSNYGSGELFDAAILSTWEDINYTFASDSGDDEFSGESIIGTYSWDAIKDGRPSTICKRGTTTGFTTGSIEKIYENTNKYPVSKTFETTNDGDAGDSGGLITSPTGTEMRTLQESIVAI